MFGDGDIEKSGAAAATSYSHDVLLLGHRDIEGTVTYLVRLRRVADHHMAFFLKKDSDFADLQNRLQADREDPAWGMATEIYALPQMPSPGRFGIRRRLSKLGMGDFVAEQGKRIQRAMDELMSQVTVLSKSSALTTFFTESTDQNTKDVIFEWVWTLRSRTTLLSAMGFWRMTGSKRTWTIHTDGSASLDGRHQGDEYDLFEEGDPASLNRVILRKDGWDLDLDRSSREKLVWVSPGRVELVWARVEKVEAEKALRKIEEARAGMKKKKEQEQQRQQEAERARVREAILRRASVGSFRTAASTDDEAVKKVSKAPSANEEDSDEVSASTTSTDVPSEDTEDSKAPSEAEEEQVRLHKMVNSEEAAATLPDAEAAGSDTVLF